METNTFLTKSPNLEIYQTDDLRKWIGIYLHACRSRNLAGGAIEFYSKKLNTFARFCLENNVANVSQISADMIRQFLISLDENGHRPAGVHCYYRSVKTFLKWYERETEPENWRNPINKVDAPFVPLEPLDPVSIETIKTMLETCKRGKLSDARDKASLLVLLDTGMRLAVLYYQYICISCARDYQNDNHPKIPPYIGKSVDKSRVLHTYVGKNYCPLCV